MLFWKTLVVLSAIAMLALVGSAWVWCDAKTPATKRKAELVRDSAVLLALGVYLATELRNRVHELENELFWMKAAERQESE